MLEAGFLTEGRKTGHPSAGRPTALYSVKRGVRRCFFLVPFTLVCHVKTRRTISQKPALQSV